MAEALKKSYVQELFASIASKYDRFCSLASLGWDTRWRRALVEPLAEVTPVLDLCTGTGEVAFLLSRQSPNGRTILGLDFCEPMLQRAKEKQQRDPRRRAVRWILADGETMPFPDQTFEAITCAFSLRNFSNLDQALSESFRVIRPDGRFRVLELLRPPHRGFLRIYFTYVDRLVIAIGRLLTGSRAPFLYLRQSILDFPSADELVGRFRKVGFESISVRHLWGGIVGLIEAKRGKGEACLS